MQWIRITITLTLAALIGFGCETAPKTGLSQALADYEARRYSLAHQRSVEAVRSTTGIEREQAAYIAGLSAYQLGQVEEAELRLSTAANSSDKATAARAKAMLGQIRLAQNRPREAATLLEAAAEGLEGGDARQAARYASMAHHLAGDAPAASRWQAAGFPGAGSGAAGMRSGSSGFTLQVGAFQERHRADAAAASAAELAGRDGLGQVSVVPRPDARGRQLYVVQIGSFVTRVAAEQARERLGRREFLVAPLAMP